MLYDSEISSMLISVRPSFASCTWPSCRPRTSEPLRLPIDSVAVRPVAFYLGPLILDNTIGGWIFGKLVSDLAFYLIAIVSYERFKALLVRAEPSAEEVTDGSVSTVEAA